MEGAGERLKKIRLEKGLSLEDVQKKTKIHLNVLKAIEEDNPVNLSPVYIKGFLKIYCKFLGVDPSDYISGYKEAQSGLQVKQPVRDQQFSFLKTASVKLGTLRPSKKVKRLFFTGLGIAIIAIGLFHLGKFVSLKIRGFSERNRLTEAIAEAKQKKSQSASQKASKQAVTKQKPKGPQEAGASVKNNSSGIRLGILAKEDCWVTLKSDGHVIFHSILKRGKSETWQAKEKMELSLSNAGVVELIVNGERISPLGKKGQARKNILITKEGLSVP